MKDEPHEHDHDDMDCVEAFDHFYEYLNGELDDPTTRSRIEHHLEHCKSCYSRSQMEKELNERMKRDKAKQKAPEALQKRLRELMRDF